MRALFLAAVLMGGCGGGLPSQGEPDPIVGLWEAQQTCAASFEFRADHTFGEATACAVGSGVGLQLEAGTYTDDGDQLVLMTSEATCPAWSKLASATYSVEPGRLELSDQSAVIILIPATAPTTGVAAVYGCFFDANGASMPFQASPLAPI